MGIRCSEENGKTVTTWVPSLIEEGCNGINIVNLQTKLFSKRKLFINGEITSEMADDFVKEFLHLTESYDPISIYINSPGGSVNAGLVMYDLIRACSDRILVEMYCTGMAASMAAVLLAGGQKGRRFIMPHSKVMIHEPLISGGMGGSATSIKRTAESILETKAITNGILREHTGRTEEEIEKATSFDNLMNAQQAVDFGICDEIRSII